jgi:glutamate--cysteine ligase
MAAPPVSLPEPVTHKRQLVDFLESGCKPPEQWRIGTEHEKLVYRLGDFHPADYPGPQGIRAFLQGLRRFGWEPLYEHGNPVALFKDGASISLEPGGQVELSGKPLETIHQTCDEIHEHLRQVKEVAQELGLSMIGLGYQPKWPPGRAPLIPKGRYDIMRRYLPTRGPYAYNMMVQTCSVQVNLDYSSEADMIKKFRIGLALQPFVIALFANSPFALGRPNGYRSFRSRVWQATDPRRCGIPEFVFSGQMSFARYAQFALDVPMYFVYRNDYIDASGQSFRDFLARRLPALPGQLPMLGDFSDHLTTIYTEVRMKQFLEMRGADGGPWRRLCALPAFWVGLLYDSPSLEAVWDLVKNWTHEEVLHLYAQVPRLALDARFRGHPLRRVVGDVLQISREGLRRRAKSNDRGEDESIYLQSLIDIAESRTPAEELLDAYHTRWKRHIDPVFEEYAY